MFLQTIKSKDGKLVFHGVVVWRNGSEFGFIPQGHGVSNPWWCKLDYWDLVEGQLQLFKVDSSTTSKTAA